MGDMTEEVVLLKQYVDAKLKNVECLWSGLETMKIINDETVKSVDDVCQSVNKKFQLITKMQTDVLACLSTVRQHHTSISATLSSMENMVTELHAMTQTLTVTLHRPAITSISPECDDDGKVPLTEISEGNSQPEEITTHATDNIQIAVKGNSRKKKLKKLNGTPVVKLKRMNKSKFTGPAKSLSKTKKQANSQLPQENVFVTVDDLNVEDQTKTETKSSSNEVPETASQTDILLSYASQSKDSEFRVELSSIDDQKPVPDIVAIDLQKSPGSSPINVAVANENGSQEITSKKQSGILTKRRPVNRAVKKTKSAANQQKAEKLTDMDDSILGCDPSKKKKVSLPKRRQVNRAVKNPKSAANQQKAEKLIDVEDAPLSRNVLRDLKTNIKQQMKKWCHLDCINHGKRRRKGIFSRSWSHPVVLGRSMEDWLRFSVCYWHTFRGNGSDPFGTATIRRPWDDGTDSLANAKIRLQAAFEFFKKLGVKYYTFHDRDVAPEGKTLKETNKNLDELIDLAEDLQKKTGIKLLWATCNLFASPRYMNGAATNPDAHVVAYAGAQVKKGLEIAKRLNAENFVFWGGREGYQTLLNTNLSRELNNMARFLKMAVDYKKKIGFNGQLLLEPKPKEPSKHQYDTDAMTVIAFLKHYGLDPHFKLNIEPNHTTLAGHCYEHDVALSTCFGMLGSIDANTGSPDLGWDTDQFPMDIKNATMVMKYVIEAGGIQPGGLNFDAKVRRESTDVVDMFIAHIGAMDTFARGLLNAAKVVSDGIFSNSLKQRYITFENGFGKQLCEGQATLEQCEEFVSKAGEPISISGKQEHLESIFNRYL
ncbi:hypothetical protein CHUAL_013771 [Chamberlinius hualienensis]